MSGDRERRDIEARLAALQARAAPLEEALADFRHQARRLGDRQERAGGSDHAAAREQGLVGENLRLIENELTRLRTGQADLERRLAALENAEDGD